VKLIQGGGVNVADHLSRFRTSAFRLEARQYYDSPKEREWFERWRQTGEVPAFTPDNDPWCKLVAEAKAAGKTVQRVRLVQEPPTDYVRFELQCQLHSVEAGEDIRVTVVKPERDFAVNDDPLGDMFDFWLFDEETVVELEYDHEGRYINAYEVTDRDYRYRAYRSMALKRSIPLKEYSYPT
jgi:hypothetical protein